MEYPQVSVIMPTLNSQRTITPVLQSIRAQEYPQERIEILVIDGGSTDNTLDIARRFGCQIMANPRVQQEYAKHLGLLHAQGQCAMFLDSDEVLINPRDLACKTRILAEQHGPMLVLGSGYRNPPDAHPINDYINCFSDPFAYFMYGITPDARTYWMDMKQRYGVTAEDSEHILLRFDSAKALPLADMAAGAMLRMDRFRAAFSAELSDPGVVPRLFYLVAKRTGKAAMVKECGVVHYSAETYRKYVNKLFWRVKVNVHYKDIPGTGFSNREEFHTTGFSLRKYLFIPWALSLIGPLVVSLRKLVWLRKPVLLLHAPLGFLVATYILWQVARSIVGSPPELASYGTGEKKLTL